jgi:cytochrome o ubiquinol oxidase subunit 1
MVGAVVILGGIVCQVVQLVESIRVRDKLRVTADPWNGRTLEWATASPPPAWNFAFEPNVTGRDAFWTSKREQARNKPGPARAYVAVVIGFAMIWHIWWLAGVGVFGAFVTLLAFAFRRHAEFEVPADQIARFERTHQAGSVA